MTALLREVLSEVDQLPEHEQDRIAAEIRLALAEMSREKDVQLSDDQLAEVRRRMAEPNPKTLTFEEFEARIRAFSA